MDYEGVGGEGTSTLLESFSLSFSSSERLIGIAFHLAIVLADIVAKELKRCRRLRGVDVL